MLYESRAPSEARCDFGKCQVHDGGVWHVYAVFRTPMSGVTLLRLSDAYLLPSQSLHGTASDDVEEVGASVPA